MDQSFLNKILATLRIAYPYYFKDLSKEESIAFANLYSKKLSTYEPNTVISAIDEIITTSKFMPSLSEIIEMCEQERLKFRQLIVNKMINSNYFKSPEEITKAIHWLETGIIPDWFMKEMRKSGYREQISSLKKEINKYLEVKNNDE